MFATLRAVGRLSRDFFVRYFLPLHSNTDDPEAIETGEEGGFEGVYGAKRRTEGPEKPEPSAERMEE